jgi:hypothetical protein
MAEVFEAADAPLSVRHLRQLIISRLPALDQAPPSSIMVGYDVVSSCKAGSRSTPVQIADTTPEQVLLSQERAAMVDKHAGGLVEELSTIVHGKPKLFGRILAILWYCFLSEERLHLTQLQVAARLDVSDSLVSSYRLTIERELRKYSFLSVGEARQFEQELRERLRPRFCQKGPVITSMIAA